MKNLENQVDELNFWVTAALDKPIICLFVFLLGQLREQLSYLKGDNFFRFTCSDCSEDGKEQYERLKLTWQQVSKISSCGIHEDGHPRNLLEYIKRNIRSTFELSSRPLFHNENCILSVW